MTPEEYENHLEKHYLSDTRIMSDVELHNTTVKINRAVELFSLGLDNEIIKKELERMDKDPTLIAELSKSERARDRIQQNLIKRGFKRGTKVFEEKEKE